MKKKLIIHGGLYKTGSSAIQTLLDDSRDTLLQKGILFPLNGTLFHPGIGRRHYYVRETLFDTPKKQPNVFRDIYTELENSGCHTAVLSYENFLSPGKFSSGVAEYLRATFDVYFVFYLRSPVHHFNTKYKEWIRRQNFKGEPGDFVLAKAGYLDLRCMLDPWIQNFGADSVTCRKFDKSAFPGRRIEFDFLEYLSSIIGEQLHDLDVRESLVNPSFTNEQILVSLLRNRYFGGHKSLTYAQKVQYGEFIQGLSCPASRGLILSKYAAHAVLDLSKSSLDYIASQFGVEIATPDLSSLTFDESFQCVNRRADMLRALNVALGKDRSTSHTLRAWLNKLLK
ncbi:hypothetical protein [Microbulbifer sp. YPW1]|uniref:hypothetical protein n=1 Tax=Microbulbifer sp. YPW1 TaxID=2745199 RepID=UPI0015993D72|nr:hypothetical protein [Microbulbifer sp. YPW1]QKX18095.1 hypothetical protein HUW35_14625 [Microbulbifer sp. YPW1]